MARKDEILKSFLQHEILKEKYDLDINETPNSVRDALNSSIPIVKAIALIVDSLESSQTVTDAALRNLINQYLNEAAI
jgi:hypothetical protein